MSHLPHDGEVARAPQLGQTYALIHAMTHPYATPFATTLATTYDRLRALTVFLQLFPNDALLKASSQSLSPLEESIMHQNVNALKILLSACPTGDRTPSAHGNYPLHMAAIFSVSCLKYLLSRWPEGATAVNLDGDTLLHRAAGFNVRTGVIQVLESGHGGDRHHCAASGDRQLLERSVDMDANEDGASNTASTEAIAMLQANVSLRMVNKKGYNPIHIAAAADEVDMFAALLNLWPEGWSSLTSDGRSVAQLAVQRSSMKVLSAISVDNLRIRNAVGNAAMHVAARVGKTDIVKLLLRDDSTGDQLRLRGQFGDTPVHIAVRHHNLDVLHLLLQLWPGASIVENDKGETPFDIAHDFSDIRLLCQYGSTRVCPVSSNREWVACTPQRREKIDAVGVLMDPASNMEQRKAAVEVLRLPWSPSEPSFIMTRGMWRKIVHAAQRPPTAPATVAWYRFIRTRWPPPYSFFQ